MRWTEGAHLESSLAVEHPMKFTMSRLVKEGLEDWNMAALCNQITITIVLCTVVAFCRVQQCNPWLWLTALYFNLQEWENDPSWCRWQVGTWSVWPSILKHHFKHHPITWLCRLHQCHNCDISIFSWFVLCLEIFHLSTFQSLNFCNKSCKSDPIICYGVCVYIRELGLQWLALFCLHLQGKISNVGRIISLACFHTQTSLAAAIKYGRVFVHTG